MKSRRFAIMAGLLAIALAVLTFAVMGCGGSSTGTSASSSSSASTGANVAHAQAALAPLSAVPVFKAPGPAFDAKSVMSGKSILSIPGTGTDPFYVQMNKGMSIAATAVGYPFSVWNNQGQLTQYQQGIAHGITTKVSLIDLLAGPDPNALKPQIDQAKAAGILVVSSHLSGLEQTVPNVSNNLPIDYKKAGSLLADWVISKDTSAHVLVIVSDEIVSTKAMRDGIAPSSPPTAAPTSSTSS